MPDEGLAWRKRVTTTIWPCSARSSADPAHRWRQTSRRSSTSSLNWPRPPADPRTVNAAEATRAGGQEVRTAAGTGYAERNVVYACA
jgi:hypothetical protein